MSKTEPKTLTRITHEIMKLKLNQKINQPTLFVNRDTKNIIKKRHFTL